MRLFPNILSVPWRIIVQQTNITNEIGPLGSIDPFLDKNISFECTNNLIFNEQCWRLSGKKSDPYYPENSGSKSTQNYNCMCLAPITRAGLAERPKPKLPLNKTTYRDYPCPYRSKARGLYSYLTVVDFYYTWWMNFNCECAFKNLVGEAAITLRCHRHPPWAVEAQSCSTKPATLRMR